MVLMGKAKPVGGVHLYFCIYIYLSVLGGEFIIELADLVMEAWKSHDLLSANWEPGMPVV